MFLNLLSVWNSLFLSEELLCTVVARGFSATKACHALFGVFLSFPLLHRLISVVFLID